jgi:hypothetical protein
MAASRPGQARRPSYFVTGRDQQFGHGQKQSDSKRARRAPSPGERAGVDQNTPNPCLNAKRAQAHSRTLRTIRESKAPEGRPLCRSAPTQTTPSSVRSGIRSDARRCGIAFVSDDIDAAPPGLGFLWMVVATKIPLLGSFGAWRCPYQPSVRVEVLRVLESAFSSRLAIAGCSALLSVSLT